MNRMPLFFLLLLSLFVSACAQFPHAGKKDQPDVKGAAIESQTKPLVTYLLDHGLAFSKLSEEQRLAECRRVAVSLKNQSSAFDRIKLSIFIGMEPGCGSVGDGIRLLDTTLENKKLDENLQRFARYQLVILQRLQEQSASGQKLKKQLRTSKANQDALEKKLDALQSIEESINERGAGAPPNE